eukprot:gene24750-9314_t
MTPPSTFAFVLEKDARDNPRYERWLLTRDGSIALISPSGCVGMGPADVARLRGIVATLRDLGAAGHISTGLHVHVSVDGIGAEGERGVCAGFIRCEAAFDEL